MTSRPAGSGRAVTAILVSPAASVAQSTSKPPAGQAPTAVPTEAELTTAIGQLGSFDFDLRTSAARTVRRATPHDGHSGARAGRPIAQGRVRPVPRSGAADGHDRRGAAPLMRELIADRNDRLRTIAYQWWEHHPDPAVLTDASERAAEGAVGVRATGAHARDRRARQRSARARGALVPLVIRGEDLFPRRVDRGAGRLPCGLRRRRSIAQVAKLEGPLQDDAITALGKIGDPAARPTLEALQRSAEPEVQPTVSAAFCLLEIDCERQEAYLKKDARVRRLKDPDGLPVLRGVVHALGMLAVGGRTWALNALLDTGGVAT